MKYWLNTITFIFILISINGFSQEREFKKTSIKTGLGLSMNEGYNEMGVGLVYSVGFQKSYGKKDKLRINPNLMFGGFLPAGITDTRDMYYKLTNLGLDFHYDLIRIDVVSLVVTGGGFINYSRGLLGTGGMPDPGLQNHYSSDYFLKMYYGGKVGLALRIDQKNKKCAYEIRPFNFQFGNEDFILATIMFGVDIKLEK